MEWALFWVTSTSVILKKDDSTCGTSHSPMVTRERLPCFTLSLHTSSRLPNLVTREEIPQPLVSYALFQGLIVFFINLPMAEHESSTVILMSSRTWELGPFRVTTQQYVLSFRSQQLEDT